MNRGCCRRAAVAIPALSLLCLPLAAADWPAHKRDAQRSSVTAEQLRFPLTMRWCYEPGQPPKPAWPEPGKELHREDFDYAFQPVAAGGLVYFGSSADDTVRAVRADTGKLAWRFTTEGPVRFAPAIALGKAYVASDDGRLYCLDARTGKLLWRFRAGTDEDCVLGNGRVIARYPCRSGALVVDNVVYVTAGVWPTEGVAVYALDAVSGREVWCNDSCGSIYVDLPHAGASGFSGVAPEGYLVASKHILLAPTGRSVPAAFDRRTGRLLYYKPEKTHYHGASYGGGVWCTAAGDLYFHPNNRFHNPSEARVGEAEPSEQDGMIVYSLTSGDQHAHIAGKYRVLVAGDVVYAAGQGTIDAIDLVALRKGRRVGAKDIKWTAAFPGRVYCLAMAGGAVLVGGRESIAAFNAADGKAVWRVRLAGQQVRGLAIADGRLLAATHTGQILSFGAGAAGDGAAQRVKEEGRPSPISDRHRNRANEIVRASGKSAGYALVVGEPDCRLAESLARQTTFHIVSLLADPSRAAAERQRLLDAGLLGARVAVHSAESRARLNLPSYFADVVVVSGTAGGVSAKECYRALRPCGGTMCLAGLDDAARQAFVKDAGIPPGELADDGNRIVRGKAPGAGEWRYPWADGGRSGVGAESRVRFPLEVLWFGGPGPGRLVDRHLMGSPPISTGGRVFIEGQHHVIAFDAYNGRELWSRHIKEVGRKYSQYYSSSLVADADSVYVVQSDTCLRLDQATGKTRSTYRIPESVVQGTAPPAVANYVDVTWPTTWRVIGPFPKGKPPLPPKTLAAMPERVTVDGRQYAPTELDAAGGVLDFTRLFGGYDLKPLAPGEKPAVTPRRGRRFSYHDVGRICYAFATVHCPKAGKLLGGAGADWGMHWFVDGKPVFNALREDSTAARRSYFDRQPCAPTDRLFDLDVTAGKHVLAVVVTSGSRGWALASASMAAKAKAVMPVAAGENPNVPNLRDLVWGYLSVADGLVLGSYNVPIAEGQAAESHLIWRSESKAVFALDKKDGSLCWVYRPQADRIVANIEIAFGDGRLFLIDGTSKADLVAAKRRGKTVEAKLALVALGLADGSALWRQEDVPLLRDRSMPSRLKSNITHLFMGMPNWGHLVYADGVVVLGANAAYDAATGKKLWERSGPPGKLPIAYGKQLLTGSSSFDLRTGQQRQTRDMLTGEPVPWRYSHAYGCGPVAGCQHILFFRSGADGFFDMEADGTTNFGAVRPGCSRTLVAANGLLLHPQGYSGCPCSYNHKTNVALISAPGRDGAWYVFPRRSASGLIRRLAVNFGAPGDRRDAQGRAWLGFPRPMIANACPAPVTLSMTDASIYHRRRAAAAITKADIPWVYSSGLCGQGRIAIDLAFRSEIPLPRHDAAPAIDGKLDEACWKDVRPVPFQNTPFSMVGAAVDFRMFRDAEHVYFGYCRSSVATGAGLTPADRLELFVADARKRVGIRFVIGRKGAATALFGTVGVSRKTDPAWKGQWHSAVTEDAKGWAAELVLPIKTLTQSGMDLKRLQLNCMSHNVTPAGIETVFLTDPSYGTKFRNCIAFRRVATAPADPLPERTFTVRLHFAETGEVKTGQRVFDVMLQGKPVLRDIDVLTEAGGLNVPVVKEFAGVPASDQMVLELVPGRPSAAPDAQPAICAVELVDESKP